MGNILRIILWYMKLYILSSESRILYRIEQVFADDFVSCAGYGIIKIQRKSPAAHTCTAELLHYLLFKAAV